MKTLRILTALVMCLLCYSAQAGDIKLYSSMASTVVVTADGTGATEAKAIERAILAAANQALGSMIVSEQTVENDQLTQDSIIQHTAGVVNSYEVLSRTREDGLHHVRIRAVVSTAPLRKELESRGAKVQALDGKSAFAEQISARNSITEGRRLVYDVIGRLVHDGVDIKISGIRSVPTDNELAMLQVPYTVRLNEAYLESMTETLERVRVVSNSKVPDSGRYLGIYVGRPKTLFFGGAHIFNDTKMVADVAKMLKPLRHIEVFVQFKDEEDNIVGTSCERYTTYLYGTVSARQSGDDIPFVEIDGRGEDQRLHVVAVPEGDLVKIRSAVASIGCTSPPTYQARGLDNRPGVANVSVGSGGATMRSR